MNNSQTALNSLLEQEPVDNTVQLRQKETELITIIEALENISKSGYYHTIQKLILDPEIELLRKKLVSEKDTTEVFRLQGKLEYAEKHTNFEKLITTKRNELINTRKQING